MQHRHGCSLRMETSNVEAMRARCSWLSFGSAGCYPVRLCTDAGDCRYQAIEDLLDRLDQDYRHIDRNFEDYDEQRWRLVLVQPVGNAWEHALCCDIPCFPTTAHGQLLMGEVNKQARIAYQPTSGFAGEDSYHLVDTMNGLERAVTVTVRR
jgi:hypothetical protein